MKSRPDPLRIYISAVVVAAVVVLMAFMASFEGNDFRTDDFIAPTSVTSVSPAAAR